MVEFVCAVCVYCVELAYCAGSGTVPRRERPAHVQKSTLYKRTKRRSKSKTVTD